MSGGFSSALEGFEIKGNLTVIADDYNPISSGNGSIEGAGSLFIDKIFNYTNNTGVNLEGSLFKAGYSSISNLFITNSTISNKVFLNGIDNNGKIITNVTSPGNPLDVANKYYVDLIASTFTTSGSGSFTSGQIIIANSGSGLSGFPSFIFNSSTGTVILGTSGSIIINNTINAISITSSNSLFTYGGITAQGKIWSNGLDANSFKITNVTSPTLGLDVANKYYVDSLVNLASGDIQPERVFILGNGVSVSTNITTFVFDNTVVSSFEAIVYLSIPTLGIYEQYTMFGVLSGSTWILNYKSIGSATTNINFSMTNISNTGQVQYTNANSSGVATVRFRATTTSQTTTISNITFGNSIIKTVVQGGTGQIFFTQGTILVGNGTGNINSFNNLQYINETLFLNNTLNATGLTNGPVLLSGGFSVAKNSFLNGIDNNGKLITNVTSPANPLDVANKYYVDLLSSNVNGSFTSGQIIVANSTSGLSGFSSFTFNSSTGAMSLGTSASIIINNTINAISITSSNSLFTYGGITAQGRIWSNGLDVNSFKVTNVTSPSLGLDAANKYYVDSIISLASGDIQPERVFILGNGVSVPTNITTFVFDNTVVSSFEAIVYLSIPTLGIYEQYTMFGVLSGSTWILNYKSIGSATSNINFSIINISNTGQVQYTNANSSGVATVRFRATTTSQTTTISNLTFGNLIFKNVPQGGTGQTFFTQGTVLIGNGVNSINSYNNFQYTNETLFLNNTLNATGLTSGPVLLSGGFSVAKNSFLNGIDNNRKLITNVTSPTNPLDVANKYYVDSFTGSGSSTSSSFLILTSTVDAISITNGGTFTDNGGASIAKSLYVGNTINSNTISVSNLFTTAISVPSISLVNLNTTNASITSLSASTSTILNSVFTNITTANINVINTLNANTISVGNIFSINETVSNLVATTASIGRLYGNLISNSGKTPISASASKISTNTYSRVLSWVYDPIKDYSISSVSFISNLNNSANTDYYQTRLVNVTSNFILGVSNTLNNLDTPNTYTFTLSTSGVAAITSASILEFQTFITTSSLYAYTYILSATLF